MSKQKSTKLFGLFFTLIFCCYSSANAQLVSATSDLTLFNLQFHADDNNAELLWIDDWYGTVTAHAQDTDSGAADDFKELWANDGTIQARAETSHVTSIADYGVTDGEFVAIDQFGDIFASTYSTLTLNDPNKQADGFAISDFDNYFTIIGGNQGESVDVTFTLDYSGSLHGVADELGLFSVALAGLLELYDDNGNLLDFDIIRDPSKFDPNDPNNPNNLPIYSGHDNETMPLNEFYADALVVSATLAYEQVYWLYAEADSEVYGATSIPEPESMFLLSLGISLMLIRKRFINK